MGLFSALVRTVVNVAKLPVALPIAALKDFGDCIVGEQDKPSNTKAVVQEIKDDADTD